MKAFIAVIGGAGTKLISILATMMAVNLIAYTSSDENASGVVYRYKEASDHGTNRRRDRDLRQNAKRA